MAKANNSICFKTSNINNVNIKTYALNVLTEVVWHYQSHSIFVMSLADETMQKINVNKQK